MKLTTYLCASMLLCSGALASCDDILDAPSISSTDETVVFSSGRLPRPTPTADAFSSITE